MEFVYIVCVKTGLQFKLRDYLISVFKEGVYESVFVELTGKGIVMGEIYRVPGKSLNLFRETYETLVKKMNSESKPVIIASDLNINLLKAIDHPNTAAFVNLNYSFGFTPLITQPTRVTCNTASMLIKKHSILQPVK